MIVDLPFLLPLALRQLAVVEEEVLVHDVQLQLVQLVHLPLGQVVAPTLFPQVG